MPRKKKEKAFYEDGALYSLSAGTPIYVKTADICRFTGKSNQWIGQLVSQGSLIKSDTANGSLFEVAETMRAWCEMLEKKIDGDGDEAGEMNIKKLRAELDMKKYKAKLLKLEAEEREGIMHRSEDVAKMTRDLIFAVRNALLSLPGRLAPLLVSINDAAEISELIRREVCSLLEELSAYRYDSSKYEECVRERAGKEGVISESDDEED